MPGITVPREQKVLMNLLFDTYPTLLSPEEIARWVNTDVAEVERALAELEGAGLVHRLHGFAWATRSALTARDLLGSDE